MYALAFCWAGLSAQLAGERHRMRRVDDDQPAQIVRMLGGEAPGHRTAPVVRHQHARPAAEMIDQQPQIFHQMLGAIGLDLRRLGATDCSRACREQPRDGRARTPRAGPSTRTRTRESRARTGSTGPRRASVVQANAVGEIGVVACSKHRCRAISVGSSSRSRPSRYLSLRLHRLDRLANEAEPARFCPPSTTSTVPVT